ncbi:CTP-dependent diacylglycerol kinase 1 [Mycena sanguinolenta]|uniref:CTP-dependent diacylglycerol kinase 1 n=1 Tax=Mycena sanguinolenta TaxID=230812 RepID=A0A8H6XHI4_9AGAR|nr:CTP-dependent diacylglycerol kinase 1 [Mycena sanguinolenta]
MNASPVLRSPPPRSLPPPTRRRLSASPGPTTTAQVVTRKVIRTLEGLGHADADMELDEELSNGHEGDLDADEVAEVDAVMNGDAGDAGEVARLRERRDGTRRATTEDEAPVAEGKPEEKKKIDWEIPRKVLHSSIGFITLALYLTPSVFPPPRRTYPLGRPRRHRARRLHPPARPRRRTSMNGVLWCILDVSFAFTFYPIDVATVAVLMCVLLFSLLCIFTSSLLLSFSYEWSRVSGVFAAEFAVPSSLFFAVPARASSSSRSPPFSIQNIFVLVAEGHAVCPTVSLLFPSHFCNGRRRGARLGFGAVHCRADGGE